eukprot:CAMPEP_0117656484 /NCGR_PEP_ID=MMETSP0804-20121206/4830_1 /TAXON_ID=1074897 /ORGANISM="Tetraselmis astigmatica, Strain CCMP880" /LENGTH=384 /DNA_ID=CAMNT_0005462891 /DNA_START=318 /DNA_END=1472 /DNA_ORIENTATION=-
MKRRGILGSSATPLIPIGKDHRHSHASPVQLTILGLLAMILMAAMYPVEKVRRENRQLAAELSDLRLDLDAHQEALKISKDKCESKTKIFEDNEIKYKQTIGYYKEAENRLSKEWCQKITDGAMAEYKRVCQRTIDDYSMRVDKLAKERDSAMKRLEPVAMCCKSATAKNKALLSGLDEATARKKGSQAVAASIKAMEDPMSVRSHGSKVVWQPGQRPEDKKNAKKQKLGSRPRSKLPVRVSGLGEEKDMVEKNDLYDDADGNGELTDTVGDAANAAEDGGLAGGAEVEGDHAVAHDGDLAGGGAGEEGEAVEDRAEEVGGDEEAGKIQDDEDPEAKEEDGEGEEEDRDGEENQGEDGDEDEEDEGEKEANGNAEMDAEVEESS